MNPKFPLGFSVNVGFMGLYRADEPATNRRGEPIELGFVIHGMRLEPSTTWDDDGKLHVEMSGWEYLIARVVPATTAHDDEWDSRGWLAESELLKLGYQPPGGGS